MQFERLERQATKNAEMLDLVAGIASANNTEDGVVQTIMESAKKLVDCAHCAFHFVDANGNLLLGSGGGGGGASVEEEGLNLSGTFGNVNKDEVAAMGASESMARLWAGSTPKRCSRLDMVVA